MRLVGAFILVFAMALVAGGCGGGPRPEEIKVQAADDPLYEPRSILQRYADGQKPASEVASFGFMVEKVRKTDPAKADILDKGFKEIEKTPGNSRAVAKSTLDKLGGPPSK